MTFIRGTDIDVSVAVLGNPNTGKSTLFNALTGVRQQTGNYPGVTVERRTGWFRCGTRLFQLHDLPGSYSLAPRSQDEMLTVNVLLGRRPMGRTPDLILCVVDANNLERNLFLVSQALDLGLPVVVAANMIDVVERSGTQIDWTSLSNSLGVPVVPIQANKKRGLDQLKRVMAETASNPKRSTHLPFPVQIEQQILHLQQQSVNELVGSRFLSVRLLFDSEDYLSSQLQQQAGPETIQHIRDARHALNEQGHLLAELEAECRFQWIKRELTSAVHQHRSDRETSSDRLDRWLIHPVWGLLVAVVVLTVLFQLVFWIADPASVSIDLLVRTLGSIVGAGIPEGPFQSLLVDGLINGVGSVLVFLPQIFLLFLILGLLEDSGYLARAAFLCDRFLARVGMSGVSVFPLLSSFACAVPGIMATRVIKNERERLITILIAPLMSCSARLPVYVLLISAFIPDERVAGGLLGVQGLTMLAMYCVGVLCAVLVAYVLRRTWLRSGSTSFVLEMPNYTRPRLRNVIRRMWDGGWSFIRDAGPIIVAATILVWAAMYFPRLNTQHFPAELVAYQNIIDSGNAQPAIGQDDYQRHLALKEEAENILNAYQLEQSYLGRAGKFLEPVVAPLGWDWRIGSAVLASFPAREVVVSTLGVIFGLGAEADEQSQPLRDSLRRATRPDTGQPLFTIPVALSLMVMFALCAQCVSTLAVIRRETNSYRWPLFTFVYMTLLAYVGAWITYRVSGLFY